MSGNKVIKPVSFNKTKEEDRKMLKHLEKRNFSGYVKKLVLADMKNNREVKKKEAIPPEPIIISGINLYNPSEEITVIDSNEKMTQRELNALRLKEAQKKASHKPTN